MSQVQSEGAALLPFQDGTEKLIAIDLLVYWRALLRGKWLFALIVIVFCIGSVIYAMTLPNRYTSTAVLAPVGSDGGQLVAMADQLGGLASLAGINLNNNAISKAAIAIEIMSSWAFIDEFIQENNIATEVYAVKAWDDLNNELVYKEKLYDPSAQEWQVDPGDGESLKPTSWELYEQFQAFLRVREDKRTGFTRISIEYYSPVLAQAWVQAFVTKINSAIRAREASEAKRNITFLKKRIEETPLSNMHAIFYKLIEEQTKALMLASGSDEYVFQVVSEPRVAAVKSRPRRALICIFGAILGGMLGTLVALVYGLRKTD